jgi:protein gp37
MCALNGDYHSCVGKVVDQPSIDWVICGGESGSKARPLDPQWAQKLKEDCEIHGVPFFMKQGSKANWPQYKDFDSFPEMIRVRQFPSSANSITKDHFDR